MKRCIAALVLAALAWWSVPVVFASPKQPHPLVVQEPDQQSAPKAHDHSCCPGAHSVFDSLAFVGAAPAAMPCGDQHPCCTKQGPDNPSSLPAVTRIVCPDSQGPAATLRDNKPDVRTRINRETSIDLFRTYSVRSMVLRI